MFRTQINILIILLLSFYSIGICQAKNDTDRKFTVVIDAGHGGKDVGAVDNGVQEKNINLKVAKQLEALIKKKLKNTTVVMTRDNDTYLTLQQRADKANRSQGDIFISIHTNSVDKKNRNRKTVAGSSVYTLGLHKDDNNLAVAMRENSVIELEKDYEQKYSGFDPQRDESYIIFEMAQKKNLSQSIRFAENVEKELVNSGRQSRGVHQAGFWVLWATSMPSVLVELDFICNPQSAKYMSSDKGAKEMAEAIFNAVKDYEAAWRKSINGTHGDLSDFYTEGDAGNLEETYSVISGGEVAVAKTRKQKTATSSPSYSPAKQKIGGERRRRSSSAKSQSMAMSYEVDNIKMPEAGRTVSQVSDAEATEPAVLALAAVKDTDKSKGKKAKKTKEKKNKEKKDSSKSDNRKGHKAKVSKLETVYKIQILASTELLNTNNPRFKGLSPVTALKENNLYKYYYGESADKSEIEAMLPGVKEKIPDAFIVSVTRSKNSNSK